MTSNVWPALRDPTKSIRLLRVHATDQSKVECTILSFNRGSSLPFTAVSYQWGGPDFKEIVLNGRTVRIRANLWELLCQLRDDKDWNKRLYWIDAICINQRDTNERNHQVSVMREIYTAAEHVIVWLGPAQVEIELALKYIAQRHIQTLEREKEERSRLEINNPQVATSLDTAASKPEHAPVKLPKLRPFRRLWTTAEGKALLVLFRLSYWKRIWIVQEIMYGRRLTLFCGATRLPWEILDSFVTELESFRVMGWFGRIEYGQEVRDSEAATTVREKKRWDQKDGDKRLDIHTLITLYGRHESTENVDKVFALAGMSCSNLEIDYSLSVEKLYESVLRIFCHSDDGTQRSKKLFAADLLLALGLHATTQMLSLVDAFLYRPPPPPTLSPDPSNRDFRAPRSYRIAQTASAFTQDPCLEVEIARLGPATRSARSLIRQCRRDFEPRYRVSPRTSPVPDPVIPTELFVYSDELELPPRFDLRDHPRDSPVYRGRLDYSPAYTIRPDGAPGSRQYFTGSPSPESSEAARPDSQFEPEQGRQSRRRE